MICNVYNSAIDMFAVMQQLSDFIKIEPLIGAGGEIRAMPDIDMESLIMYALMFLAGMGIITGFMLAVAARLFSAKTEQGDVQANELTAVPCSTEGYAGAWANKRGLSRGPCGPAGEQSGLVEKKTKTEGKQLARVICGGGLSRASVKYRYEGVPDCRAVLLTGDGDKSCSYGCLGYGTCERACPFGAIEMSREHLPVIKAEKCTACGTCASICPKMIIELIPADKPVFVACHSRDKAADTRRQCSAGCVACGICVKVCPFDAPTVDKNLCFIDTEKCRVCGLCVPKCPTGAIADRIIRSNAVISDACTGCGICLRVCPADAISGHPKSMHAVDPEKCVGCGLCVFKCPVRAIEGTYISGKTGRTRRKLKKTA